MPRYDVRCGADLALKLGGHPARRVFRPGVNAPLYEVPENCVAIHTRFGVLIWPLLVRVGKKELKAKK